MWRTDPEPRWHGLADEVFAGMKRWRTEHPTATWAEIEAALDERLAALRGRMLQDAAEASAAADFRGARGAARPARRRPAGAQGDDRVPRSGSSSARPPQGLCVSIGAPAGA